MKDKYRRNKVTIDQSTIWAHTPMTCAFLFWISMFTTSKRFVSSMLKNNDNIAHFMQMMIENWSSRMKRLPSLDWYPWINMHWVKRQSSSSESLDLETKKWRCKGDSIFWRRIRRFFLFFRIWSATIRDNERQVSSSAFGLHSISLISSSTSIEQLSNEAFSGIIDYFDGSEICKAFSPRHHAYWNSRIMIMVISLKSIWKIIVEMWFFQIDIAFFHFVFSTSY